MKENKEFICVNEWFGHLYGTPFKVIEEAINDKESFRVLDFPLSKRYYFENYPHAGVVILPESEEQLINQIKECEREERMEEILQDYEVYHKNLSENSDSRTFIVINYPEKHAETAEKIDNLVKDYFRYFDK